MDPIGLIPQSAVIPAGASLSGAVGLGAYRLHGLLMPAAWTPADLTFQVTIDGVNYYELYDAMGNEIEIVANAARYIALDPTIWRAVNGVIARSGNFLQPVKQIAQASIGLVTRAVS